MFPGNLINGIVVALYGDRWQLYGEYRQHQYRVVGSLYQIPETNVTLCANYTSNNDNFKKAVLLILVAEILSLIMYGKIGYTNMK